MLRPVFTFDRRGGSNKNLVAMSESINDASFGAVVGRHLHFHPVPNRKANEPPVTHFAGNVRENETVVRKRDAKHGPGEHRHDCPLQFDRFFGVHNFDLGRRWEQQSILDLAILARGMAILAVNLRQC